MYQVKISHRHSPPASQPSLSFSVAWHIPKVQTLEQFHRWTWNVVMLTFNAFIFNSNTSFSNTALHDSLNILYLVLNRVLFTILLITPLLTWCQIFESRNAQSSGDSISTHFSETAHAHLLQARGSALNSRAAGPNQTSFALLKPACMSWCTHINSPVHDDKTVHGAKHVHKNASEPQSAKNYQKCSKFCTSFL